MWRKWEKCFSDPFWLLASNTAYFFSIFSVYSNGIFTPYSNILCFIHNIFFLKSESISVSFSFALCVWFFFSLLIFSEPIHKAAISTITSVCIIGFWVFRCHFFSRSVTLSLFLFLPHSQMKWIRIECVGHKIWYCASHKNIVALQ